MEFQTFTHQKGCGLIMRTNKTSVAVVSVMYTEMLLHHREVIQV